MLLQELKNNRSCWQDFTEFVGMKRLKRKSHKNWNHNKCSIINPICLKWVTIWHPLLFSSYLRHGFRTESEDVEANRVNNTTTPSSVYQSTLNQQATLRHVNWVFVYHERSQKIFYRFLYLSTFSKFYWQLKGIQNSTNPKMSKRKLLPVLHCLRDTCQGHSP